MRTNVAASTVEARTHEGGRAERIPAAQELERAVSACMLWENTFYESGVGLADRIAELCRVVPNAVIFGLAVRARTVLGLRHVPLWLLVQAARKPGPKVALTEAIAETLRRPDELAEFLALYWRDGRKPLAAGVKRGLARAFVKFSEHQLAKWNRDDKIKLRDVMFLVHPKPKDEEQAAVWKRLAQGGLAAPDTWEVALSSGADKRATWERLLAERKLGVMALLMNLRNMDSAGVEHARVREALAVADVGYAFPYRFLSAAKHAPWCAEELSAAMLRRVSSMPRLGGETHVIVDVSGSMDDTLSAKGDATRLDAACSVAVCARELCGVARVFTFSNQIVEVGNVRGLALAAAIAQSQSHQGTYLARAVEAVATLPGKPDRVIVITDEQAHDGIPFFYGKGEGYVVNVAPYKPGLEAKSRGWTRINGWSDRLLEWIAAEEGAAS